MVRPAHRRVSRVVLLDENDRFLLLLTASPRLQTPVVRWLTPGGGVEDHESHAEGAIRELFEETGLRVDSVGEPIWSIEGQSIFNDGHVQSTYSEYFVVRTTSFELTNENWMDNEFVDITDVRWWTVEELQSSGEKYSPEPLVDLIQLAIEQSRAK
ncbi:8-oxo-dGTP pyrophosphatase MutT (NUDIX family) [Aurantimicrobium minutum]|uniref:NUDIX hydrolase n=1 Tax=Aurantimicrobium minutum TaxID=708131 RepID=UPI00247444C2|nr:NUDIX domain-containing protein [Aurantimicrobium minutum]MDH6207746.1 8-oxo-dGTP pyrophosphatase MutT (NUDIX family) [Aurantimicrobium minutum]MDH6424703.1 8-oxo-dGTP pyrophosphatase MutT (NUDIX family) [Aurantimicrobium minutum]